MMHDQSLREGKALKRGERESENAHSHVLALESLDDEVGYDSAVVRVHPGSERIEDSRDSDVDVVLPHKAVRERLHRKASKPKTPQGRTE
jgi:hypothetical protein